MGRPLPRSSMLTVKPSAKDSLRVPGKEGGKVLICSILSDLKYTMYCSSKQQRVKKQLRNNLCVIARHKLSQLLPGRGNGGLIVSAQFFKVAKIEWRRKRVEETSWSVSRVAEGMGGSYGYHHECALTGTHRLGPCQKLQLAFEDVKALFMGMMNMRRRCWGMRRHYKFSDAQCSPCMRSILQDNHVNRAERKSAHFSRLQYH